MALGKADAQTALARATAVQLAQSEAAVQRADARVTELTNELADREEELSAAQRKLVSWRGFRTCTLETVTCAGGCGQNPLQDASSETVLS